MDVSGGTDDIFEEAVETLGGGAAGGGAGGASEPEGEGQTPAGSPWWVVWCDRIGVGEEGLDATWTNLGGAGFEPMTCSGGVLRFRARCQYCTEAKSEVICNPSPELFGSLLFTTMFGVDNVYSLITALRWYSDA